MKRKIQKKKKKKKKAATQFLFLLGLLIFSEISSNFKARQNHTSNEKATKA